MKLSLAYSLSTSDKTHSSTNSKAKRWIDILGALVGLSITALLFIPIAIAIQLNSFGSIFYSQMLCGLGGQLFRIWKFCSMVMNADQLKYLVQNQAKGCIFKGRSDIHDSEDIVNLDIRYQQRWSVHYDILLISKTLWVALGSKGAC